MGHLLAGPTIEIAKARTVDRFIADQRIADQVLVIGRTNTGSCLD
jgi:hypothetical protein